MSKALKFNRPLLKSLPAPVRLLVRPMLAIALGLHAFFLFTPLPAEQKATVQEDDKKEEKVTITKIGKSAPAARTKINRPKLPRLAGRPKPANPLPPPAPKPETAPGQAGTAQKDPFADFPHFQPSTPDCFGVGLGDSCRIASANLATVAAHFKKALPEKKYQAAEIASDPNRRLFQVTKGNDSIFLTLLADGATTVYVLAPQEIKSLKDLRGAIVVPETYYTLLAGVLPAPDPSDPASTNNALPEQFTQPQYFYTSIEQFAEQGNAIIPEFRSGIDGSPSFFAGQLPDGVYATLESSLRGIFEEVSEVGIYGGGKLYRLKKANSIVFLNLVPTKAQDGTIIITWTRDPRS
jgi:hypothetical protein